jgi:very-short-patch-repair endonuclease
VARRQHGVITRGQLLELGFTPSAIEHRRASGRLRSLHRGVFAVGHIEIGRFGRWMAAVLACGQGALLSHQSAAELWEIRAPEQRPIEVTVPARDRRRIRGLVVHRRTVLSSPDRRTRNRIPVTAPARTLADLAARLSPHQLESAINEADGRDLIDPERLRDAMRQMRGEPGAGRLLRLLDRRVFRLTDSELERMFLRLVRRARLPMPQTGVEVGGFPVDFLWPELGLIVETDGLRYHRTAAQQARDRRRDQIHAAAGLTTLRFTYSQVVFEEADVRGVLARVIGRLSRRPAT